jgi:hypothetical protein
MSIELNRGARERVTFNSTFLGAEDVAKENVCEV